MQRVHLRMRNVQEAPQPRRERRLTATARAGNQNTHAPLPLWLVHKSARTPVDTKGGLRPCTSRIHSPPSTATPAQLNARRVHAAQAHTPHGAHDQRLENYSSSFFFGLKSTPASLRCSGVIGAGAAVSGSKPLPVFGNAITSRIESTPAETQYGPNRMQYHPWAVRRT